MIFKILFKAAFLLSFVSLLVGCTCSENKTLHIKDAKLQPKDVTISYSCHFAGQSERLFVESCGQYITPVEFQMDSAILSRVQFNEKGLAELSLNDSGCFWMNNKGLAKKTFCFDNGSDAFQEGLARYIDERGKFGFMDEGLNIVIKAEYDFTSPFEKGRSAVCVGCQKVSTGDSEHFFIEGGKWSVIGKKGELLKVCDKIITKGSDCIAGM